VVEWLRIRGVSAEGRAILGNPAEEIVRVSEDEGCGLIAMSTHGRNLIGRSILGSVTDRVLHSASVPVLTITPDRARMYQEEGTTLNTVVVPLDGSELAELALPYAEELATALSLEVLLVRVVRTDHLAFSYEEFAGRIPDFTSDLEREAARYLEAVSEGLRNRGLAVGHRVLGGAPAPSLLDLARETPRNLIAMTTHGRSGLTRWVMGSVAEAMIRGSGDPVLVVRPRDQELSQPVYSPAPT
jgi:nucleotide-binding universal stress UspA family protein